MWGGEGNREVEGGGRGGIGLQMCSFPASNTCGCACTFNLPDVNGRVEAFADVHDNVRPHHMVVPRQCVHLHLTAGHSIGEVLEHRALTNRPIKVELGEAEGGKEGDGAGM